MSEAVPPAAHPPSSPLRSEQGGAPSPAPLPASRGGRLAVGELLFALGITAAGGVVLAQTRTIAIPPSDVGIGPRAVPYVVGLLLLVVGSLLVVQVLRGHVGEAEGGEDLDEDAPTSWTAVILLVVAIAAHVFLIIPLGWPIAAMVLFAAGATVLGARPWWRTVLVGAVLALLLQYAFGALLGLSLPAGPLLEGVSFLHG